MRGTERAKPACVLAWGLLLLHCDGRVAREAAARTGGDPRRGADVLHRYGCGGCHEIPGIDHARGRVGPSLEHLAERTYLAGQLPNTAANVIRWVQHPRAIRAGTAMPELGVTPRDARDMAAYLDTLR